MIERQELHCHQCQNYVQFDIDTEQNGDYALRCPVCGHQHLRTIIEGQITENRWGSVNNGMLQPINVTWSATSTYNTYQSAYDSVNSTIGSSVFLYSSWLSSSRVINGSGIINHVVT